MQRKQYEKKHEARDASKLRVGIAVSEFNEDITGRMLEGAREVLQEWGVRDKNIHVARTYGSFELPIAALGLIRRHRVHAVVALGCIIKGETPHDVYLAHATSEGLMRVMLDAKVPVGFGVITTNDLAQAEARSRGKANKGREAAVAALMAALAVQ